MSAPVLHRLANGVRVVIEPMPGLETAAVGVWVRVGARWERAGEGGVAHLFEHMAFKGAAGRDARAYAEAVERLGASVNAATGYERTNYYARALREHAPQALDLVCDIVLEPHWDEAELEKEKNVVLQEIGEAFDQPDDRVFELHQAAAFPGQPLGAPILGTAETLAGIGVAGLSAFRAAHLTGPRVVVCAAGAVEPEAIVAIAEARFGALPDGPALEPAPAVPAASAITEARRLEQCHLVASWPAPAAGAPQGYAARVLSEIFGGGMSSRLFQEVREARGLVYAIDSWLDPYEDHGRIGVYAGCAARDGAQVAELIRSTLAALAADGPSDAELARAKAMLAAQLAMAIEAPLARCEARAHQLFAHDRLMAFAEIRAAVKAVDAGQVMAIACAALAGGVASAVIGPKAGLGAGRAFAAS